MGLLTALGGIAGSFFGSPAIGAAIGGAIEGSQASGQASQAQQGAAQAGIDEQRRQFDLMRQTLSPYVQAGAGALGGYSPYRMAGTGALPALQQYSQAGQSALDQQMALLGMAPEAINPPMQVGQPSVGGFGGGFGGFGGAMGALSGLGGGLLGQPTPTARSEADIRNALIGQYTSPIRTEQYGGFGGDLTRTVGGEVDEAGLAAAIQAAQAQDQAQAQAQAQAGQAQAGQNQVSPSMRYVGGQAGQDAQRAAIERISGSEQFKALAQQAENAFLQNAAATGGLRGGNLQGAFAEFRPQLLNQLIEQQYNRLGGLATQGGTVSQNLATAGMGATGELARLGQSSAAGVGTAGLNTGTNIANLMGQQGAAQAGGIMGQQQAFGGVPAAFGFGQTSGLGTNPFSGMAGQLGNLGAAFNYGTNIGSQQTSMLANQERGMF